MNFFHRLFIGIPCVALLLLLAGCGGEQVGSDEVEKEHPEVVRARELIKQQDREGARNIFHSLLREHPDMAYVHLQLGFIYQAEEEQVKSLYHFQHYLEARGQTENAEIIRIVVQDELKRLAARVGSAGSPDGEELQRLRTELEKAQRQLAINQNELDQSRLLEGSDGAELEDWQAEKLRLLEEIGRLKQQQSTPIVQEATPVPSGERTYTVQRGDTLSGIAAKLYGRPVLWQKLYNANRSVIPNKDRLTVGTKLVIPE